MRIIVDAQISPAIAAWINRTFEDIDAVSARSVGLQYAEDSDIYAYAKENRYTLMSKDGDFLRHIKKNGYPPHFIWVTCGNTTNAKMREVLSKSLRSVKELIEEGEPFVEISDL